MTMELDEFKEMWQRSPVTLQHNQKIMELIRNTSDGPLAALKKAFKKQIRLLIILPFIFIINNADDVSRPLTSILFWSYVLFCSMVIYFSYRNYHLVSEMSGMDTMVKINLQQQLALLRHNLKRKIIIVRIALIVFIILVEVVPYIQHYRMLEKWHSLSPLIRFSSYAAFIVLQYFLSKRISERKYGKHLSHLESLIQDME